MHEKYGKKGVACVSVSVDAVDDKDDVLAFLKKQKATLTNYLLDEKQKVWQEHFGIDGPPARRARMAGPPSPARKLTVRRWGRRRGRGDTSGA